MSREKDRRTPLPQLVVTADGFRVFDPEMVRDRKDLVETTVRPAAPPAARAARPWSPARSGAQTSG